MKKGINNKALILPLFILVILVVNLVMVSAAATDPINEDAWYGKVITWFGYGETWAQVLVAIFVSMIIVAGSYDVLSLTGFRSSAVRIIIGIGLAGILAMIGSLRAINGWIFGIAGEMTAVAIAIAIGAGALSFALVHLGTSWLAVRIERASGDVEAERAATNAKKAAAAARGVTQGITGH
jgi:hypothetical protein